jgi:type I restriction enzyme S subunit
MSTATTHIETDKELVPEIRFEGFDGGIVEYLFNDIFLFSTGKNIKQKEASPEFETPCVRYGELYHMYNEVINEVINKTNLEKSELRFSKGDEILLPSAGEDPLDIGSASALTLKNVAIGRTINILRPMKVDVYSQIFASYYINQKLRKKISTLAKGSSISNVYNSDLKTLKINLPTLPEQQKIASFLSAVDEKIQQLTKKKALLSDYKKGVMQQLFSGQLRFKDENGEAYPDWEEKRIGDLTNVNTGGTPRTMKQEYWGGNIRWMNSGELNLKVVFEVKSRITKEGLKNSATKLIPKKCILIGLAGQGKTRGTAAINMVELCTNQSIASILPNYDRFIPEYLFQNIDQRYSELRGLSTGDGGRGGLNLQIIKSFKVPLPSVKEQQKIANYLSGIDTKIEAVNTQITQTQTFKKGLLQGMFV